MISSLKTLVILRMNREELADGFRMIFCFVEILKLIQGRNFTWQIKIYGPHLNEREALWII